MGGADGECVNSADGLLFPALMRYNRRETAERREKHGQKHDHPGAEGVSALKGAS